MMPPAGPPPAYSDALNHPTSPVLVTTPQHQQQQQQHFFPEPQSMSTQASGQVPGQASSPITNNYQAPPPLPPHQTPGEFQFPGWCSLEESQLPPVYKQVYDASLV